MVSIPGYGSYGPKDLQFGKWIDHARVTANLHIWDDVIGAVFIHPVKNSSRLMDFMPSRFKKSGL